MSTLISDRIKERGFNDASLAQRVKVERSMITKIKLGKAQPSLRVAVELSELLDLPPETFNIKASAA